MENPFEQWYQDIPLITKIYCTCCALSALAIVGEATLYIQSCLVFLILYLYLQHFGYVSPFHLYYHPSLVYEKLQVRVVQIHGWCDVYLCT